MQRLDKLIIACIVTATVIAAGCDRTSDQDAAGSLARSEQQAESSGTPPASTSTAQSDAVRGVVDAYISERTAEGMPYYIDSSATEFVGFEEEIMQEDDRAMCLAKFASERDTYYVRFILSMETGRYVIRRVILDRLNNRTVGQTLYDRDSLVL